MSEDVAEWRWRAEAAEECMNALRAERDQALARIIELESQWETTTVQALRARITAALAACEAGGSFAAVDMRRALMGGGDD